MKYKNRSVHTSICVVLMVVAVLLVAILLITIKQDQKTQADVNETVSATQETETESASASGGTEHSSDNDPPQITGPSEIFVGLGDTVAYKSYVKVTDNEDPFPSISIDVSAVDLNAEGTYTAVYIAKDSSGNTSYKEVTVVVGPSVVEYVDEDVIYEAVDALLATVITDDMDDLQKVFAVFFHCRDAYSYVPDDGKLEYKQEAYKLMMTYRDSCYANTCLAKLMLERLGYDCIIAEGDLGIEYADDKHYWDFVSIDSGLNWYYMDCAWWLWQDEEYPLCMMTETMAAEVSARHNNIYTFNRKDYPEISEVSLWDPGSAGY